MRNGSAYISTITYTTKELAKLAKSLRHSMRVEIDGESSISYKQDTELLNKILFNGQSEEFLQNLNEMTPKTYLDYIDAVIKSNMEKEYQVGKLEKVKIDPKDSQIRSKSLKYLTTNIQDTEFKELLKKFADNPHRVNKNNLIIYFDTLDSKKAIEKNLHKYIGVVEKIGKAQGRREAKLSVDKVEFVEMVVKIPYENNITNISSEDMLLYNQDFFKRKFPDYDIVVGVSHNDELHQMKKPENIEKWEKEHNKKYEVGESGHHSHLFINSKNNKTGEFDYWVQQHLVVAEYLRDMGHSEEVIKKDIGYIDDKGIRHQTRTQVSNQGKNLQEFLYQDINDNLFKDKNYNAVLGYNDLSITAKQDMENNKRKSINNRSRNGHHLEEKLSKDRVQELEEKIKILENTHKNLDTDTFELGIEKSVLENKINENSTKLVEQSKKIEDGKEIFTKIEKDIDKIKGDREKVKKTDMEEIIKISVNEMLNDDSNYKGISKFRKLDTELLKPILIKTMREMTKIDIYDNDIKKIKNNIQEKSNIKLNDKNITIKELKNKMGDLTAENYTLEGKYQELETNIEERIELSVETIKKDLTTKHRKDIKKITDEHKDKELKTDNIIHNLEEENKGLKFTIKDIKDKFSKKYDTFSKKLKSIFVNKNKIIKNDKKYRETNEIRLSKVTELEEEIVYKDETIALLNENNETTLESVREIHPNIDMELLEYSLKESRNNLPDIEMKKFTDEELDIDFDKNNKIKEENNNDYGHRQ